MFLAVGQALTSTVVPLLTSVSSLSGAYLAPAHSLSTVPVTATVVGTLVMIYPASVLMGCMGRRSGFLLKAGIGVLGGVVCYLGLWLQSFSILTLGAFLLGIFSAFGQYYRFAAIDAARTPVERTSAVSIVTGAGVAGGVADPFLGGHFAEAFAGVPYGAPLRRWLPCACCWPCRKWGYQRILGGMSIMKLLRIGWICAVISSRPAPCVRSVSRR